MAMGFSSGGMKPSQSWRVAITVNIVNVLSATELYTVKWQISCYVFYPNHKQTNKPTSGQFTLVSLSHTLKTSNFRALPISAFPVLSLLSYHKPWSQVIASWL